MNKKQLYHVNIVFPSRCQKYIKLQCGKEQFYTDMPEAKSIIPILNNIKPKTVLDVGCGIGRATVYFAKYFNWTTTKFYLYDGNSGEKTYAGPNRTKLNEFYNNADITKEFCLANNIANFSYINAEITPLNQIPDQIDLAYSFLAFGFHWSIDNILDELWEKLNNNGVAMFGTQGNNKQDGEAFTQSQIKSINLNKWKIVSNIRKPHRVRKSVLVIKKI